jgi:hypothetical protein
LPFNSKLMPAAFPALTTTSPLARTEVCAGAMRVSWATGLPSAVIETQLVSSARISTLKVLDGLAGAAEAVLCPVLCWVAGLAGDECAEGAAAAAADSAVIAPEEGFADDTVPAGDVFPGFSGAGALGCCLE